MAEPVGSLDFSETRPASVEVDDPGVEKVIRGWCNLPVAVPAPAEPATSGTLELDPLVSSERPLGELDEVMEGLETGTGIRHVIPPG